MKKMILGLVAVALVGSSTWFITSNVDSFDYVATVDSEISQLEAELAALDQAVAEGTLTVEQATNAKIQIVKRLNTINNAADRSNTADITPAQRAQLLGGLDRLKTILTSYQDTLTTVEKAADPQIVQKKLRQRHVDNTSKSLKLIVADTIQDVEDTIVDIITDDSTESAEDTRSETAVDEITETESTDTDTDTETDKDHVEETEEVTEDEATETTDETVAEETPAEDTTTTDEETEIVS